MPQQAGLPDSVAAMATTGIRNATARVSLRMSFMLRL